MNGLPHPPDAYWENIPWWAYLGFMVTALLIVVVIGPWMIQRARGAPSAILSREQALAAREDRADRERDADIAALRSERDRYRDDYDRGWAQGRGMTVEAHRLWHELAHAIQHANSLLRILQRIVAGKLQVEVARELVDDLKPLPAPAAVPTLVDVPPLGPHETRYS